MLRIWKRLWEPFGSCLLNSTANPAHFHPNWAGLAILFSRQIINISQDIFSLYIIIFIELKKYIPQNTFALTFLTHTLGSIMFGLDKKCCQLWLHQNFDPILLAKKLSLIFMGIKQFFLLYWKKKLNGRLKKNICRTASRPYRLSHINTLCINQYY